MASLGHKSLIACLHRDALSLVFSAAWEDAVSRDQKSSLTVQLNLSHVCRNWRAVVLAQPRLWTEFFWKPGDNADAARAVLERSRAAALRMDVALGRDFRTPETGATTILEMLTEGHAILEAATAHFHRAVRLRLSFGLESLQTGALVPFFDSGAPRCSMPRLRFVDITFSHSGRPPPLDIVPRLNIACEPLLSISLSGVYMADLRTLVGPETRHLDLNCLDLPLSELHTMLDVTPNLRRLDLSFCTVFDDLREPLSAAPRVSARLDEVNILSAPRETLRLVRKLIPAEALVRVREVGVLSFRTETPLDAALEFLRIDKLSARAGIASMEVSRHGVQFKTAAGEKRNLSGDMPSLNFLHELFASSLTNPPPSGTGMVSALRELHVSLGYWDDLMRLFEAAGASLPALEEVGLSISQDDFLAHRGELYSGEPISAPRLESIEVRLYGRAAPTLPLVQRFIVALWCFSAPENGSGGRRVMYYDRSADENLLGAFCEIYDTEMERFRIASAAAASPPPE